MSRHPRDKIRRKISDDTLELDDFLQLAKREGAANGFCQAIQYEVAKTAFDEDWKDKDGAKKWAEFPWITLVLGSGPVGLPDPFWGAVQLLPKLVNDTIRECTYEGNKLVSFAEDADQIVKYFLDSLTEERVGDLDEFEPYGEPKKISEFTAALVLVAAQLTRVFHTVSLRSSRPVSRWGAVVAKTGRSHATDDLAKEVMSLQHTLDFALRRLRTAPPAWTPGQEFIRAVGRLLQAVDDNLSSVRSYRVALDHLREVTDVAWQSLVGEICGHSYPGWTELMLDLVLLQGGNTAPVERRPRWRQLDQLSQQISGIIRPAAERSWEQRWATTPGARRSDATRDFYYAAATVLWRQVEAARLGQSSGGGPRGDGAPALRRVGSLPHAVAFVTSFDLELEMALLRARPDGEQKLSVVVPVYLAPDQAAEEGEFLWLQGVVDLTDIDTSKPDNGKAVLNRLAQPKQWRVMYQGRMDLPDHPIVVRLSGSPLMTLPELPKIFDTDSVPQLDDGTLASDLAMVGVVQKGGNLFVHSATVDEYLALRQAETEYFWVYSRNHHANSNAPNSRALPKSLLACGEPGPVRYWITVGVPMKDPAVRLRVLSQMGSRRFIEDGRAEPADPTNDTPAAIGRGRSREIPGLAINWKLDDEESMLLSSLGLLVIKQGRAEDFAGHLAHHAWHLGAFAANRAMRAGIAKCPEEPPSQGNVL